MSLKYLIPIGVSVCAVLLLPIFKPNSELVSNNSVQYFINESDEKRIQAQTRPDSLYWEPQVDSLHWQPQIIAPIDTPYKPSRTRFDPPKDRYTDPFSAGQFDPRLFYDLSNVVQREVQFVPDSGKNDQYIITERIGDLNYRPPTILNARDFYDLQRRQDRLNTWRELSGGKNVETATQSGRTLIPRFPVESETFQRIFGGDFIEFRPTGFVNLDFSVQTQRVANPIVPIRQQRSTAFLFDPHANINLTGQVGEKLQIAGNFDTKASFQFENNFKLEYTGFEEDIIQKIEFGNVSFPLTSSLIQGSQNLFGVTTQLKFGRLRISSVFANQRARTQSIDLQGGAQRRNFEIAAADYDENRHYFLGQFFRNGYEQSLSTLPQITSGIQITRLEVYVTNRNSNTQDLRNIVAFQDLGESSPFNESLGGDPSNAAARNESNNLSGLTEQLNNVDNTIQQLENAGLENGSDFVLVRSARKLSPNEFTFNSQLGYLSLLAPLKNDEVLAVAYEYTFNGISYQVGDLTGGQNTIQSNTSGVLSLKMLQLNNRSRALSLPVWDLMMKNVYPLNAGQINQNNFILRVVYKDDLTGIDNPTLQDGINLRNVPLLQVFNLDRLNQLGDPQEDGNFDYIEGATIDSRNGRIIFPILEPFGSHLEAQFIPEQEQDLISQFVFDQLYEATRADALQAADKNKFFLTGSLEGTASANVSLPGINISPGSVIVMAGNIPLVENVDYSVDYTTGQVELFPPYDQQDDVTIEFEQADLFNFQTRRLLGTRLDYEASDNLILGATILNLSERPVITRTSTGTEPVNNTIAGFDVNYQSKSRLLTRLTDALPLIQTKEESNITVSGEYAQLFPGAARLSGEVSYIDDFEGARTTFNLTRAPQRNWKLGATPQLIDGANERGLENAYRRARLAWYNIDNNFFLNNPPVDAISHYERRVEPQEIFPNFSPGPLQTFETTLDLAYYPSERGPYNYNPDINLLDGSLPNPEQNYGAITRAITSDVDFDNANVEYIEFWLLDPFINGETGRIVTERDNTNNTTGGDLYINLGDITEDVIPDGRHNFENGLPVDGNPALTEPSLPWGRSPAQQFITPNFDNSTDGARANQDVGLDGLRNDQEATFESYSAFIQRAQNIANPEARDSILQDISGDNFRFFLDYGEDNTILQRYKRFNGLDGNSPITGTGGPATSASTNSPDNEDLNVDNTVSEVDAYYQYRIPLRPGQLRVGSGYIIDQVTATPEDQPGLNQPVNWYLFRIPIREFDDRIGNIDGFKSIRFIRLFMTNFRQPAVLRMARLQIVASQWRRFLGRLSETVTETTTDPQTTFNVSVVNIEENGSLAGNPDNPQEIPYRLPPGVIRDIDRTTINNRQLNEQSMQLETANLGDGKAQAIFRNYNLDLLSYKRLRMFIHAQRFSDVDRVSDGEVTAFVRLGTDFDDNYYEIEVPLRITGRTSDAELIWPDENEIDIAFSDLTQTKVLRNNARQNQQGIARVATPFSRIFDRGGNLGNYRLTVVGNPDLSAVQVVMIGIRNPTNPQALGVADNNDSGSPKSVRIWVNELRITEFDQTAGWAAVGRANIKLADFADVSASVKYTTFGFGGIDQRISERTRATTLEYDVAANIKLEKLFPEQLGLRIPMYVSYARINVKPRFNPLDPDVEAETSLSTFGNLEDRNNFRSLIEENTTRNSISFTGVKKERTNPDAKVQFFDIENFSLSYAWSQERSSSVTTANFLARTKRYSLAYNFSKDRKFIKPFEKIKFLQLPILNLIGQFNFNPLPNQISVRADLDRSFNRTILRAADLTTEGVVPLFQKRFLFNRSYDLQWQLSESLSMSYSATMNAVIDEPFGEIDTEAERDSIIENFLSFGRPKNYQQQLAFNYQVPINKLPLLDWVTSDVNYTSGFQWRAGAVARSPEELGQQDTLGNVISNTRQRGVRVGFDLSKLYAKWGFLKEVDQGGPPPPPPPNDEDTTQNEKPRKRLSEYAAIRAVVKVLTMVKRVNFTYSINESTTLPGFRPLPNLFGMADNFDAPGAQFAVFGSQDPDIRQRAIEGDSATQWLVTNRFLNQPFTQTRSENLNFTGDLEPFKDFKIQLDARLNRQANYQELFRADSNNIVRTQNPVRSGSYTISHVAILTAFKGENNLNISEVFERFSRNRVIVRERLRDRLRSSGQGNLLSRGDYALNSSDVLIPAFIAAYTGQDADDVNLSPFPRVPIPNWRIDYAGLNKLEAFKDVFTAFSISHSYSSNYSVNSYTTSLQYGEEFVNLNQDERDENISTLIEDGTFVPIYVINQVSIDERFSPLIGINMRTKSNITLRFDYNRDRNISLNLTNAQVAETKNQSFVVSVGFIKKNLKLPIRSQGKFIVLKNDVDFRLDMTVRDSKSVQRQFAQSPEDLSTNTFSIIRNRTNPAGATELQSLNPVTNGNLNFQLRPTVNYEVNQQLSFQFFYEYTLNNPRTSGSFRRTTATAGVQLRYNILQ